MSLIEKYIGESEENKIDVWLKKNKWEETHGIALYTSRKYPGVGVDTNSGTAEVTVYKDSRKVFNDGGAWIIYTDDPKKLQKAVELGYVQYMLFNKLKKKYGSNAHLTDKKVSIYPKGPSITVYFDQFDQKGLLVSLGSPTEKENELNHFYIKFDNQVVKNTLLQIELNHEALKRIGKK